MKYLALAIVVSVGAGVAVYKVMKEHPDARDRDVVVASAPLAMTPTAPDAQPPPLPTAPPEVAAEPSTEPFVDAAGATAEPDRCDEVACVLDNYERACCEKFRRAQIPQPRPVGNPAELDRSMISAGIGKIKTKVLPLSFIYSILPSICSTKDLMRSIPELA